MNAEKIREAADTLLELYGAEEMTILVSSLRARANDMERKRKEQVDKLADELHAVYCNASFSNSNGWDAVAEHVLDNLTSAATAEKE